MGHVPYALPTHYWSMSLVLAFAVATMACSSEAAPEDELPEIVETFDKECYSCHGNSLSPAPPRGLGGVRELSAKGVGAHRSHIGGISTWHSIMKCESCHLIPAEVDSPGHIDDGNSQAELTFSALASTGGLSPELQENNTCNNVYCHGATLTGGTLNNPMWTQVDGSQKECGTCHGAPPPAPHPPSALDNCGSCHPTMQAGTTTFLDPSRHIDGVVDVGDGTDCVTCHGSDQNSAPPTDLAGNTDRNSPGVGAHRQHLGDSDWRRTLSCSNCHNVPSAMEDPGHLDGDNVAEVPFDELNPVGDVNFAASTCDNLYCHGDGKGSNGSMSWTSTVPMECDSCHGAPPAAPHTQSTDCGSCHPTMIAGTMTFRDSDRHIDGILDVNENASACDSCHGSNGVSAPPSDLAGNTARSAPGVGAHRKHLGDNGFTREVTCASCHTVPDAVDSPGHLDGDNIAEVPFGPLNPAATVNFGTSSCDNLYCHGDGKGNNGSISWTSTTAMTCNSCHQYPPAEDHPTSTACGSCHPNVEPGTDNFLDASTHIDGVVNVIEGGGACDSCHGSNGNPAPPTDLSGNSNSSSPGVGAHSKHLAVSSWSRAITCETCHVVPGNVSTPGHLDGDDIPEVPFDSLNPAATVNFAADTCDNLYCHGDGQGNNGSISWTSTTDMTCGSCHDTPAVGQGAQGMSGKHDKHIRDKDVPCEDCHAQVVSSGLLIIDAARHINGANDILMRTKNGQIDNGAVYNPADQRCSNMDCHGNKDW
jgi:predicted CxxxxCH...CXXCH cytochrome family protein